jgi:hypothetical protein
MPTDFADLIGLSPTDDNRWSAEIPDGWDFMGVPNGGLVSSVMATALVATTGRPDPITSTAHFVRPASAGPVVLETGVIRTGRRLTTARAELRQGDEVVAHLVASRGDLTRTEGEVIVDVELPPMPPPGDCVGADEQAAFQPPPIARRLDLRLHPDQVGFARGEPSGEAVISGWVEIPFGASTALMPLVADALPPSLFNTGRYLGPLPTIELTVHTHARPSPGPVAARFRTDHAGPRYLEEDGWVSDATGKLVAVSRQIAVLAR